MKNRRVLITGANRGIGFECAKAFIQAGARVWIGGRSKMSLDRARAELRTMGGERAQASRLDVVDPASVEKVFAEARKTWGGLDAVVHTAGVLGPIGNFWELPADGVRETLDINAFGSFLIAREATRLWKTKAPEGRGKIILFADGSANGSFSKALAFRASKAAATQLCESVAQELSTAGIGIDCNAIAPGLNETELLRAVRQSGQEVGASVPFSKPIELCQWLLSSASDGISGRLIDVADSYKSFTSQSLTANALKVRRLEK